ncbi:hypothetical protein ABGB12_13595 [Actinocorallia sp. B10E7]|uniref:hypothetical protein n=1 Tax=Actinocorallia sp. B10E7 TaxID=3153558 RepID=UPI00325E8E1E
MSWLRRALSVLVTAAGAFVVVICAVSLVIIPQQVAENPPPPPTQNTGSAATGLVVFPLVVSAALLAGLLLLWSGVRGVRSAGDPRVWSLRQRTALWACLIGALLALFIFLFGEAPWTGLQSDSRKWGVVTVFFYGVLGFLLIMMLALQEEDDGDHRPPRDGER